MDRTIPRPGEMYADQEGELCQILCVADDFDTREKMVVYQALYGSFECLVRPIGIFMRKMQPKTSAVSKGVLKETKTDSASGRTVGTTGIFPRRQEQKREQKTQEEQANPALLEFLDADTLEEKYQVIKSLQHSITDRLIDDFAVTLDLVIPDGRVDDRYQQLLSSVRTMQKFETTRFRR